jgi:hypothetical protein
MSVYASFPLPVMTYSILHRPIAGTARDGYESTIAEMHRGVEEESALFSERRMKVLSDLSARQSQILRGSLSQFLETPIRSDDAEVQRIFLEAFGEHRAQVAEEGQYGAFVSWAGVAAAPLNGPAWLKRLESNAHRSRRALGLEGPKGGADVYESVYVVRGGLNLDILEHVVRDRLGIYASAHGRHIGESAPFVVAAHNLLHASGDGYWKSIPSAWGEAVLLFDKPAVPYDEFRAALTPLVDGAVSGPGTPAATLWQRKLGLGRGSEFALRVLLAGHGEVIPFLDKLRLAKDPPFAKDTFAAKAGLFIKQLFYPRNA